MSTPVLPNELWQKIFTFAALSPTPEHAWTHLWTNARRVNKTFHCNLAQAFLDTLVRFPRRCVITFDCGRIWVNGRQCHPKVEMFYHRLSAMDPRRVVFRAVRQKSQDTTGGSEEDGLLKFERKCEKKKYARWERGLEEYTGVTGEDRAKGGGFDKTPYVLSIYGASLDGELPGLKVNFKKRKISFEWEGMLNEFCREWMELYRRRKMRFSRMIEGLTARNTTEDSKPQGKITGRKGVMSVCWDGVDLVNVRRERIVRFYNRTELGWEMTVDFVNPRHENKQFGLILDAQKAGIGKADDDDVDDDDDGDNDGEEKGNGR